VECGHVVNNFGSRYVTKPRYPAEFKPLDIDGADCIRVLSDIVVNLHLFAVAGAKYRSPSAAAALASRPTVNVTADEQEQTETWSMRRSSRRRSRSVGSLFYFTQQEVIADGITSGDYLLLFLFFDALT